MALALAVALQLLLGLLAWPHFRPLPPRTAPAPQRLGAAPLQTALPACLVILSLQWWQVIIVNVARQASKGCGDLIFSSHLTFMFLFAWTYAVMGALLEGG